MVINFARAKDRAFHFVVRANFGWAENFFELSAGEFLRRGRRELSTEQTFRRHDYERFDEVAFHLPTQNVKVLRRRGEIADLNIVLSAKLEKPFETTARMFRTLSFVTMR